MEEGVCPMDNNSLYLILLAWQTPYYIHSSKEESQPASLFKNSYRSLQGTWFPQARDLVPARLRREKDEKTAVRKAATSNAVGVIIFQQQAFSQWDDFNEFVGNYIISFQQTQIQVLANKVLDFRKSKLLKKAKAIFKKDHPKRNRDMIEMQAT